MMIPKGWFWFAGACLAVGVVWHVLPGIVVVFNDDYGYLRSVVTTLQHGRPWTDDWLEPWAASLSLVSALIFKVTGSFLLATQGLQAVMAGVGFWAMAVLFKRRGLPVWAAMAVALVILFFPTLMVKWVEFTALIIYAPCLLWALYLAEKQRWGLFFVVWTVAVASRQSALAWLALPGMAVLNGLRPVSGEGSKREHAILPALICLVGLVVYLLLSRSMNVTHAQRVMTTAMWRSLSIGSMAGHFALGVGVFLVSLGCGAFVLKVFGQNAKDALVWSKGWPRAVGVCMAAGIAGWFCLDPRTCVAFDHPFYSGPSGRCLLGIVFGLAAAGWLLGGIRLQAGHVACAVGGALMVSLRGVVYDYYLIDVALIGLFSVVPTSVCLEARKQIGRRTSLVWSLAGSVVCVGLLGFEWVFVGKEQRILDRYAAVIRLCEPALRAGRISPAELSVGPFGYYGWHLYPYFIQHDGAKGAYIGDLENYLRRNSLAVTFTPCRGDLQKQADLVREARAQANVFGSGVFEIGWRGPFLFVLRRTGQSEEAKLQIEPEQFRVDPFPLNDAEWRLLIANKKVE